ncbi:MAG: hypothetical protein AB1457_16200 [Chloroflexota bacterium]
MMAVMIGILKTWAHILIGLGVILAAIVSGYVVHRWYAGIIDQIRKARESGKLPKY